MATCRNVSCCFTSVFVSLHVCFTPLNVPLTHVEKKALPEMWKKEMCSSVFFFIICSYVRRQRWAFPLHPSPSSFTKMRYVVWFHCGMILSWMDALRNEIFACLLILYVYLPCLLAVLIRAGLMLHSAQKAPIPFIGTQANNKTTKVCLDVINH